MLSAVGLADFAIISLYQLGVIRRLPDVPGRWVDSNQVNASLAAYPLGVPDAPLGALMYATTMTLAGTGGTRATGRPRVLDWLLGGVALAGAAVAARYLWEMATSERRLCPYCLVGAGLNFGILGLAIAEVRAGDVRG